MIIIFSAQPRGPGRVWGGFRLRVSDSSLLTSCSFRGAPGMGRLGRVRAEGRGGLEARSFVNLFILSHYVLPFLPQLHARLCLELRGIGHNFFPRCAGQWGGCIPIKISAARGRRKICPLKKAGQSEDICCFGARSPCWVYSFWILFCKS